MTTRYPGSFPETCPSLLAGLTDQAAHWQHLAPRSCSLTLLDLDLLRPLMEDTAAQTFLTGLLSPAERDIFQMFTLAKRRLEWLGGRLAAKYCLHRLLADHRLNPTPWHRSTLLPDAHGRPCLMDPPPDLVSPGISISHSRRYAAALVCPSGRCGIDIQQTTPTLFSVRERFAKDQELALFPPQMAPLTRLGLLWVAKEATKKCLLADHPSFFGAIRLTAIGNAPKADTWTARCVATKPAPLAAAIRLAKLDEYCLASAQEDTHA